MSNKRYIFDYIINDTHVEYYSWVIGGKKGPYVLSNTTEYPNHINEEYRDYKLGSGDTWDCEGKLDNKKLFKYQQFIKKYFDKDSPNRGVLLYYGLGAGKTRSAIEIAKNYIPHGYEVVFISPAILIDNFASELIKWGLLDEKLFKNLDPQSNTYQKNIKKILKGNGFYAVSYNAPNKLTQLQDAVTSTINVNGEEMDLGLMNKKVIIIDEIHNLARMIHNSFNGSNKSVQEAIEFYEYLLYTIDCRIIGLSGTPLINVPSELSIIFNILRGPLKYRIPEKHTEKLLHLKDILQKKDIYELFPTNKDSFDEYFVDWDKLNIINQETFKKRIMGLVSFYSGAKGDIYPDIVDENNKVTNKWIIKNTPMSKEQLIEYEMARGPEREKEKQARRANKANKDPLTELTRTTNQTFKVKSRQISNFALPPGVKEFRPSSITEGDITPLIEAFENNMDIFKEENLKKYSPKMLEMLKVIKKNDKGSILVYSNFKSVEGVEIFSRVLQMNGYADRDNKSQEYDYKRYAILGEEDNRHIIDRFNSPENKDGKLIRILLGTSKIAEGWSLFNIRKVLIMEPHWNMVRLEQLVGRARRICSHHGLPKEERNFRVYLFLTTLPNKLELKEYSKEGIETIDDVSTDATIYEIAQRKERVKNVFVKLIKEAAIDCELNKMHNDNDKNDIKCLKFPKHASTTYTFFPDIGDDRKIIQEKQEKMEVKKKTEVKLSTVGALPDYFLEVEGKDFKVFDITPENSNDTVEAYKLYDSDKQPVYYIEVEGTETGGKKFKTGSVKDNDKKVKVYKLYNLDTKKLVGFYAKDTKSLIFL
jgi:superfamily II DNA or RNA helicase